MAASTVQPVSKSAKKKAAKAIERSSSPAPSTAASIAASADRADDGFESPYIKELQKNIRNVNKKIVHATKTDSLLAEHKGKTLDELVAAKILNTDQKTQILKKPALQAQLASFEEQLIHYQRVHDQYAAKAAAEKAGFDTAIEKAKADATAEAKQNLEQAFEDNLLLLSQFLRLAAYRRGEATDSENDESQAIEGVLLAIYSGDSSAVAAMTKLMGGAEEQVISVPGERLESTYSDVRTLAKNYTAPVYPESTQPTEADANALATASDAHAEVAEIEAGAGSLTISEPAPSGLANGQANGNDLSLSQEWVDVTAPQEQAVEASAPGAAATHSWADDQPEAVTTSQPAPVQGIDGFHQVQRNRGRHEREGSGNFRGRGRGEYRGRGGRGDGRGRGRGNNRNAGGAAPRGGSREEE